MVHSKQWNGCTAMPYIHTPLGIVWFESGGKWDYTCTTAVNGKSCCLESILWSPTDPTTVSFSPRRFCYSQVLPSLFLSSHEWNVFYNQIFIIPFEVVMCILVITWLSLFLCDIFSSLSHIEREGEIVLHHLKMQVKSKFPFSFTEKHVDK